MAVVTLDTIRQPVGETGAELGSVDLGPMSVLSHRMPAGVDYTDLLRAACGDVLCPVPHYFVITAGKLAITYTDDGSEETASAGDVAYLRPGHTIRAIEDTAMVEISPADGNHYLMDRIMKTGLLG
jgi:hypothetical protein